MSEGAERGGEAAARLVPLRCDIGAGLEVFLSPVNCSEAKVFRDGLKGEGVSEKVAGVRWEEGRGGIR